MTETSDDTVRAVVFRVPKISELIAARLREQIIRGELHPGDILPPENELTTQFGISRPTLREAFRILESENLLAIRRGSRGGPRVLAPDPEVASRYAGLILQYRGTGLEDVQSRLAIEPYAARMLADRADARVVEALEASLEAEQVGSNEVRGLAGHQFHRVIVELAGNATLRLLWEMVSGIVEAHTMAYIADDATATATVASDSIARGYRAHRNLVRLVAENAAEEAEQFWRLHLEATTGYFARVAPSTVVDLFATPG
jgi:DNA-binding FadR family transcriptional regulator